MSAPVIDIAEFKAEREPKSLISRRRVSRVVTSLYTILTEAELSDLFATLRFDLTPADVDALETFTGNLQKRIEDRVYGRQRTDGNGPGTSDQR